MRPLLFTLVLLAGCSSAPPPKKVEIDVSTDAAYTASVEQLATLYREAAGLVESKKPDEAGAILTKTQPMIEKVLSVPHPTLKAMQTAADLDELYGKMLLSNRHYGFARMMFQKNLARWRNWSPHDDESSRRFKLAASQIAECDKNISQ